MNEIIKNAKLWELGLTALGRNERTYSNLNKVYFTVLNCHLIVFFYKQVYLMRRSTVEPSPLVSVPRAPRHSALGAFMLRSP
jgi:hypothetical protein